jgi:N-acetylneuraminic acid mutarotase
LPICQRVIPHAGIATDGRYIYIVSGYIEGNTGGQTFGTVLGYRYDPENDSYSTLPNLPAVRAAGSIVVAGRELHYFGGTNSQRTLEVGDHWALNLDNFAAGWQVRAALPNPRHHMGAISYGGKVYAIGGQHKHDGVLIPQDDVHMYDPLTDSWTQLADLPEGRNHVGSTSFVLNDKIYVLGGQYRNEGKLFPDENGVLVKEEARNTVFVYDFASNTWSEAQNPLPTKRHSAVGGTIGGKLYFSTGSFATSSYEGTFVSAATAASMQAAAENSLVFRAATLSERLTTSFESTAGASLFFCAPANVSASSNIIGW